ncbi:MAG: LPS export ABC transporter periplasmic protein LptC [Firmicutes bacterium]|nr:LPS export ABC transporter periplasmic protein LptC [Bacillota bacterium]
MRFLDRKWIYAAIAIAVVIVAAVAAEVFDDSDSGGGSTDLQERSDENFRAQSVEVWRFGPDGRRQWEFRADSVVVGEQATYRGIRDGRLHSDDGLLTFEADEVVHDESTGDIIMSGNVTVCDDKGNSLRTERILWDSDLQVMTCPGPVVLMSKDVTISGDSMIGDWSIGELEIAGRVRVTWQSGGVLTADRVVYDTEDESAEFEGLWYDDSM